MPLYITEYASVATLPNAVGQVPQEPPVAEQTVSISVSSAQSANFNAKTRLVRVHADAICSVKFGVSPVATTGSARFIAGQTEYRGVPEGGSLAVAAISNT